MIKFIFKWLLRLFILAVVLVVTFFLSLNSILRVYIEHQIRVQTGMDAEIGRFHLGLAEPTIEIQNLKIYNPPDFGGAPFLNISEIHIEYDREALAKGEIHLTLMRFNLAELDIVKNQAGQTNIFALAKLPAQVAVTPAEPNPKKSFAKNNQLKNGAPINSRPARPEKRSAAARSKTSAPALRNFLEQQTGFEFAKKIDVLNVSVGRLKFIDLKNPRNDREQTIGLENIVIPNVKSEKDLEGLAVLVYLRSGGFFESLGGKNSKPGNAAPLQNILNLIGVAF